MYYVTIENNKATSAVDSREEAQGKQTETRWDWKSFERAQEVAAQLNEATGLNFVAVDCGSGVFPRFDVTQMPKVGDEVSRGFNGDYYPCGTVVSISATGKQVMTSDGRKFIRRKQTAAWVEARSCFCLVKGHINRLNPEF